MAKTVTTDNHLYQKGVAGVLQRSGIARPDGL